MLGELYLQAGDLARAREALEHAVQLSPQEAQSHYKLALVYTRSGFADKARAQLEIYNKLKENERNYPTATTAPPPVSRPPQP